MPPAPNPSGFLGSKVVGEPPLICSNAVFFAIKDAVAAARATAEQPNVEWFAMPVPATPVPSPDNIYEALLVLEILNC